MGPVLVVAMDKQACRGDLIFFFLVTLFSHVSHVHPTDDDDGQSQVVGHR
jgi:hypothetical protein